MGWPSPTMPLLISAESPVPMTTSECSWMISIMYLGNLFSPLPSGSWMNRFGRKRVLIWLNLIPLGGWMLILCTKSVIMLFLARFLFGFWRGIVFTVVPIFLSEIADPRIRGSLSTCFATMGYLGVVFEYAVGPYVRYNTLAALSLFFCVAFFFSFAFVPETPYFWLQVNNMEKARKSLLWLRGDEPNVDEELKRMETSVKQQMERKGSMKDLFCTAANRKAFIIVGVLSFLQRLSGIGAIIAYSSVTLPKNALGNIDLNECIIILGVVWIVSTFISSVLVDRLGRKILLVISALGCTVSLLIAGTWFFLNDNMGVDVMFLNWSPFVCFVVHGFFYSIGLNPIVNTMKGEIFSSNIKALASALTTILLALSSFFLNKSYQVFADYIGMYFNFWMYAFGCILAIIFSITYVIETKGKSLQAIQDKLNREPKSQVTKL